MIFGATYFSETGKITGGAGTYWLRDKDTSEQYDFSDGTWKTAPVTPAGTLTEDAHEAGYYEATLAITAWGTRRIAYRYLLTKAGESPQAEESEIVVIGGVTAVPVYAPAAAAGQVNLLFYVRTQAGAIPTTAPTSSLVISYPRPCGDYGPPDRSATWDSVNGCLVWAVPINCKIFVTCTEYGLCGRFSVATAQIVLNTATAY